MKKFKTRLEYTQDAIDYYWGKPERQAVTDKLDDRGLPMCTYKKTETSKGCAIGRNVDDEIKEKLAEFNYGVSSPRTFGLLPKWMKDLGQEFLIAVQNVHDRGLLAKEKKDNIIDILQPHINVDQLKFPE